MALSQTVRITSVGGLRGGAELEKWRPHCLRVFNELVCLYIFVRIKLVTSVSRLKIVKNLSFLYTVRRSRTSAFHNLYDLLHFPSFLRRRNYS